MIRNRGRILRAVALALLLVAACASARLAHARADSPGAAPAPRADLASMTLDQLMDVEVESVVGASRYTQRSLDAPARVTVVTAEDIRDHGYRTLAEALRSVAGVFVSNDRIYDYLGMRGLGHVDDYNSRVLVMVDGHRTNDNLFEGALIGTDFVLDLEQVERIEVIRGPTSALYGSNAVLGVINILTRPAGQSSGLRLAAGGGSLGTRGGRIAYGRHFGGTGSVLLAASGFASDGNARLYFPEYVTPETHGGVAHGLDGEDAARFFGAAALGDFHLQGVFGSRRRDVPTATFGTVFDDPRYRVTDMRGWLDLGWRHTFAGLADLSGRAYVDDYEYKAGYPTDYSGTGDGPVTMNRDWAIGRWVGAELSAHRTLFGGDELVVGGEWRENLRQDQWNYDESPWVTYYRDRHSSVVWALFAEDALQLAPRLRFNAGVRHDHYSDFGGSAHPRVALVWSLRDRTSLKFVYGSAFRVPTAYEYYLWVGGTDPHRSLRPETFRTGEVVLESYLGGHVHASASGFVVRGEDFIREEVRDGIDAFYNSGDVRGTGVEVELAGHWGDAELRLGGAHERLRFHPGDLRLPNSPTDMAQVSAKVPIVRGSLWATADLHTMGTRLNPLGADVRGAAITDANLVARPGGRGWQLTLGVRNLFDVRYGDVAGPEVAMNALRQDGRTVRARLDLRYW